MYFAGRWVPLEVMNAFFVLWGISVVVLGTIIWWLRRKAPPDRPKDQAKRQPIARRRKPRRRKG